MKPYLKTIRRTRTPKTTRIRQLLSNPLLIIREKHNRSFYEYFKYFWQDLSAEDLELNFHIELLCEELQKIGERVAKGLPKEYDLLINIPPGTTKTSIVSILFPIWCWTRWYWMKFITASHDNQLSLENATAARDILRSPRFVEMYPDLFIKEDADNKSNYRVVKKVTTRRRHLVKRERGGNRYSTSVGASPLGFHGHIHIVDDPLNPKKAVTKKGLEAANHFMDQTLSTRKVNKAVTPLILIMQRLHQNDPSGNLLSKDLPVKHICLPAELGEYEKFVKPAALALHYKEGLLDPKRMSRKVLRAMKEELGQYGYAGQVGQNPSPPGGGMFKVDRFNIVTRMPSVVQSVRYWDKAGSNESGAYTVGVLIHKTEDGKFLISDVKRGQWASEVREKIILRTAEADGVAVRIYHEQEPGSGGKQSAEQTTRMLIGFVAQADKPVGDKVYRADPFSVQVNNGEVSLLHGNWNNAFLEEYKLFPVGTYKDQVDAGSGGFSKLVGRREARSLR